jgi:hypothetical protein
MVDNVRICLTGVLNTMETLGAAQNALGCKGAFNGSGRGIR